MSAATEGNIYLTEEDVNMEKRKYFPVGMLLYKYGQFFNIFFLWGGDNFILHSNLMCFLF